MPGQHWGWWPGGLSILSRYAVAGPVAVARASRGPVRGSGLHTVFIQPWAHLTPDPRHLVDLHRGLRRVVDMHLHQRGVHRSELVRERQHEGGLLQGSFQQGSVVGASPWRLPVWLWDRQMAELPRGVGWTPALIPANAAPSVQAGDLAEIDPEARLGVMPMATLAVQGGGIALLTAVGTASTGTGLLADGGSEDDLDLLDFLGEV